MSDPAFLELFSRLQTAGLPLGLNEYHQFLRALDAGFGRDSREGLKKLCKTLWIKSEDENLLFDEYFDDLILEDLNEEIQSVSLQKSNFNLPNRIILIIPVLLLLIVSVGVIILSGPGSNSAFPTPGEGPGEIPNFDAILLIVCLAIGLPLLIPIIYKSLKINKSLKKATNEISQVDEEPTLPTKKFFPKELQEFNQLLEPLSSDHVPEFRNLNLLQIGTDNFPITSRHLIQSWRYLRKYYRLGSSHELDVKETVNQIGKSGILIRPIFLPLRINKIELLLLIDIDGSMVPFHHFGQELAVTAKGAGRFNKVDVFYFHNVPTDYLYLDTYRVEAANIDKLLSNKPDADNVICVLFSDAGAARGGYSSRRRRSTLKFVKKLQAHFKQVAWLNPLPRSRWDETTAQEIAKFVPMFEMTRYEFTNMLHSLNNL